MSEELAPCHVAERLAAESRHADAAAIQRRFDCHRPRFDAVAIAARPSSQFSTSPQHGVSSQGWSRQWLTAICTESAPEPHAADVGHHEVQSCVVELEQAPHQVHEAATESDAQRDRFAYHGESRLPI